jgi:hypothetical protein
VRSEGYSKLPWVPSERAAGYFELLIEGFGAIGEEVGGDFGGVGMVGIFFLPRSMPQKIR